MPRTAMSAAARRRPSRIALFVALLAACLALPASAAAATTTTTTVSAAQTTLVAGDSVAITAAVSPGPGGGTVTFTSSQGGPIGTAPIDPETNTAGVLTTLAPGSHSIVATFSGFGDFAGSASTPITVTVNLGTTDGTPTTTSLTNATPASGEGDPVELRASVSPAPAGGRVQFLEGNRLVGTAPVDPATGRAALAVSTLAAGTHQIVAIFTGAAGYAASASPSTPITVGADQAVQATGVSISHATIYPIVDGVGDTVNFRGRAFERTSITIAVLSATGRRVRAIGLGTREGAYSFTWNGRTSSGAIVPAGRYSVVQTLVDRRGNRLVVSSPLTVSHKRLVRATGTVTREGIDYDREGTNGFGLVIPREADGSVHVWGNTGADWAFVSYTFTVPSGARYPSVRFEVIGEAQAGRTGATLALLDASGEPVAEARTGTANGRYAVTAADTSVDARRVTATITANGTDRGAFRVFSVRLVYTYEVFR